MAAVLSLVGAVIGTEVFPATAAGYRELLEWRSGRPLGPGPGSGSGSGDEYGDVVVVVRIAQ